MIKLKRQIPRKIDGKYFLAIPKHAVDLLKIDESVEVEAVITTVHEHAQCSPKWDC